MTTAQLGWGCILGSIAVLGYGVWYFGRRVGMPSPLGMLETGDDAISAADQFDTFGDDRPSSCSAHLWREFDGADRPFNQEVD